MYNDDDYENISEEEFQERLRQKGDMLIKILNSAHEVGGGLELIISVMAQKFTIDDLKDVYISVNEYGQDIVEYGETMHELNQLIKEDDDESNRN